MIITSDYITVVRRARRHVWFRGLGILGGIILVASYFFYQSSDLITAPHVTLIQPANGSTLQGPVVLVEGEVAPGIALTINGITTYSGEDGRFRAELLFPAGLHTVNVAVKNRFGRTGNVEHQIVVE